MQLTAIRELVQSDLTLVEDRILKNLDSEVALTKEIGKHIIEGGGKRLRPILVLLTANAFGYQGEHHLDIAAILELIHTATLLHDDVVDNSRLRRGRQSAHMVWGNPASVLVGDFVYSRSFQMMVTVGDMRVMEILANTTNRIAQGEVLQLINCGDPDVTEERYMQVIRNKTATLFRAAAKLGAIIANCDENVVENAAKYGLNLGIAYQLIDDALDYTADNEKIGKNIGDDLAEGKTTLPLIHILRQGTAAEQDLVRDAIRNRSIDKLDGIVAAIKSTEAIEYSQWAAKQQLEKARAALDNVPPSAYRDALYGLLDFAVERKF